MSDLSIKPRFHPVRFQTPSTANVVIDSGCVRLASDSQGPLAPGSRDESIGRLILPRGTACDRRGASFLVDAANSQLLQFDPLGEVDAGAPFQPVLDLSRLLPGGFAHSSTDQTPGPDCAEAVAWSVAATADELLIAHKRHPALFVVGRRTSAVDEITVFSHGRNDEWAVDVATDGIAHYVLTDRSVYRRAHRGADWSCLCALPGDPFDFTRLLIDGTGNAVVWSEVRGAFDCLDQTFTTLDAAAFPLPGIVRLAGGARQRPASYLVAPQRPPYPTPHEFLVRHATISGAMFDPDQWEAGFLIDQHGRRISRARYQPSSKRLFRTGAEETAGRFFGCISHRLDAGQYRTVWDRVTVELKDDMGPGEVVVESFTSDDGDAGPESGQLGDDDWLSDRRWQTVCVLTSDSVSYRDLRRSQPEMDFPIRSGPGQFLWLRLRLRGDGFSTPIVSHLRAVAPRDSYVSHLPAVFREDDVSRDFLERFVGALQREWEQFEDMLADPRRLFDPQRVGRDMLPQLAERLGIDLPGDWDEVPRRRFLTELTDMAALMKCAGNSTDDCGCNAGSTADSEKDSAAERYRRRGTLRSLTRHLESVICAVTELRSGDLRGYPWVIEGHRERNRFWLTDDPSEKPQGVAARLSDPAVGDLWDDELTQRFKLGASARLGRQQLLPHSDPLTELYRLYANRIRVVVPACWLSREPDRQAFLTVLEREKAAHVASSITLVHPGLRIGVQSTVGIDTILSDSPPAALPPPERPTFGLNTDLLLAGGVDRPPPLAVGGTLGRHEL